MELEYIGRYHDLGYALIAEVQLRHLAQLARSLSQDWQLRYCLRPVRPETFCENARFQATCLSPSGSAWARPKVATSSTTATCTPCP